MQENSETIGYADATDLPKTGGDILEYNFLDDNGAVVESHAANDSAAQSKANIKRAAELLNQIRNREQIEKKMLRAAINLENLYTRKQKNRKRDKLAKAARKRNRK
jgi:hypothetical protein